MNSTLKSAIAIVTFILGWLWIGSGQSDRTLQGMPLIATPLSARILIQPEATLVTSPRAEAAQQVQSQQTTIGQDAAGNSAAGAVLSLFVSVKAEGDGRFPIFANGRYPRLRLTKLDTSARYEMPLNNVAINVPLNLQTKPDDYKVSVEDLPDGYAVKSILYRADEPGVRLVDVRNQNLQISSRAIGASFAGVPNMMGAPDLPIAITLMRTTAPTSTGIRVAGTSEGMILMPKLPVPGGSFQLAAVDATVNISGKPGILYSDGTFEFAGVSPGLHTIILKSNMAGTGTPRIAAAHVVARDRNVDGVSLQTVPLLPRDFSATRTLPPPSDASVPALSSLTLRARDEATQQPINSGWITLSGTGAPVKFYIGTSTPVVEIPNMLPGEYVLEIESYGYKSKTQVITIGFGNTPINLTIAPLPK